MKLSLAFSPCPNDTFAFHAMVNHLVDTEGLEFDVYISDVEDINKKAEHGVFDICKLSYHAFFYFAEYYLMLRSGSALGFNNGPLMVSKTSELKNNSIFAVPGKYTTASLLLKIAYPEIEQVEYVFSEILPAIKNNEVDGGVIIHEGRFVFENSGLCLINDFGVYWEKTTTYPLPLGGIAVKRSNLHLYEKINRVLKRSIEYALDNPMESSSFVREHAQELSDLVLKKHIEMFVNEHTVDIGMLGIEAVRHMYSLFLERNTSVRRLDSLFILEDNLMRDK